MNVALQIRLGLDWLRVCLNIVYFAKNWKYCSKIIFKYVNSAVRPIFNENFDEKRDLWTVHGIHWKNRIVVEMRVSKKKKNWKMQTLEQIISIQIGTSTRLDSAETVSAFSFFFFWDFFFRSVFLWLLRFFNGSRALFTGPTNLFFQ